MYATDLARITEYDIRTLRQSDEANKDVDELDQYIGIQRSISKARVSQIAEYVDTLDATFPTSIVIAIQDDRTIDFSDNNTTLTFYEVEADDYGGSVPESRLARILDGQHRLAGMEEAEKNFQLSVTVFPRLDVADQAYVFSTVNLAQTKVNKSLVFDLFSYARSRSPQKTCHNIAVVLNRAEESPFHKRIKRLGTATPGVLSETLTQATFVQGLLPYLSHNTVLDRDAILRGRPLQRANSDDFQKLPFRNLFIDERDEAIVNAVWWFFASVRTRWPGAWRAGDGQMLLRTNGYRAFSSIMGRAYVAVGGIDKAQPAPEAYAPIWELVNLRDEDFVSTKFQPGSSGERALYRQLESALRIYKTRYPRG